MSLNVMESLFWDLWVLLIVSGYMGSSNFLEGLSTFLNSLYAEGSIRFINDDACLYQKSILFDAYYRDT